MNDIHIFIRSEKYSLTGVQAEMALAWAKKQGTPYVQDPVFIRNFLHDFSQALGKGSRLTLDALDFSPVIRIVEAERQARENLTPEERKALTAARKIKREVLLRQYGHAIVNGEETELANYVVEPSGIFMGRGAHPLRGRWKEGASESDITLNLSPDAPMPPGNWHKRVWQPDSMWVASWLDKLTGKVKYVWLHDSSPIKQARESIKFDKAHELHARLVHVRDQLERDLGNDQPKIRKIATACYLIDALGLRVGDEKEADEADTVGATTLRPEHVKLHDDGIVEFHFLGKDSVEWHKKIELPEKVRQNLADLAKNARPSISRNVVRDHPTRSKPQLFPGIGSRDVNAYLSNIMPGLTAKVFRTHHATKIVEHTLESMRVRPTDPEFVKWEATVKSNLEAAKLCNHTKMPPKNLQERKKRYQERIDRAKARIEKYKTEIEKTRGKLTALKHEHNKKIEAAKNRKRRKQLRDSFAKRIQQQKSLLDTLNQRFEQARIALGKLKIQGEIATKYYKWNLTTSQKSYIDPRIYYSWGLQVGYDVLEKYYSRTLQRKFAWVKEANGFEKDE